MNYIVTPLQKNDYHNGFLQLLEQLTTVNSTEISYDDFSTHFDRMTSKTFVIKTNQKIIATASIFIESKYIHKLSSVGHIEDVVVDMAHRNQGLGKMLIDYCITYAKKNNCYKVILNCSEHNMEFYKKCGFNNKNVEMSVYI